MWIPLLLLFLFGCLASITTSNDCNTNHFQVQNPFNVTQFAGKWFITMYSVKAPLEWPVFGNLTNRNVNFYSEDDGSILAYPTGRVLGLCLREKAHLTTSGITLKNRTFFRVTESLSAKRFFQLGSFFGKMFHPGGQVPFWILATDYHRYCVIYGCRDVRKDGTCLKNQTNFLVMSRNQTLDEEVRSIALKVAHKVCLNETDLKDEIQTKEGGMPVCEPSGRGNVMAEITYQGLLFILLGAVLLIFLWWIKCYCKRKMEEKRKANDAAQSREQLVETFVYSL